MNNIHIRVFENLSSELKTQTDKLRYRSFRKETYTQEQKERNEEKYLFEDGCFRFVIAFLDEKPVGYIRLFKRIIHSNGKYILLGGIGGVCTDPQEQRKGVATQMLKTAIEELKKEGCDIAYLCTNSETLEQLYGRVGFVPLNHPYTYVGKSGKKYTDTDGMIAPINSQKIFQQVLNKKDPFDLEGMNW